MLAVLNVVCSSHVMVLLLGMSMHVVVLLLGVSLQRLLVVDIAWLGPRLWPPVCS